jgi:hypothetical protein
MFGVERMLSPFGRAGICHVGNIAYLQFLEKQWWKGEV